jgi:hypothetical protein
VISKGVIRHLAGLLLGHDLDEELPFGKVAALNGVFEVAAMIVAIHSGDLLRFFIAEALNALLGLEVELDPNTLAFFANQRERVLTEHIHIAKGGGNAPIRHRDGDLVKGFGEHRPEIPGVIGIVEPGLRIAFHRPVQAHEVVNVAKEENRGVIAHEIPVPLLGVELDGTAADVAFGIGRTAFASHRRNAHEDIGLLAFLEDGSVGVLADVLRAEEITIGAPAFGVGMRRSGITSRLKWAIFSKSHTSLRTTGPLGPAVIAFSLSGMGAPTSFVRRCFISFAMVITSFGNRR